VKKGGKSLGSESSCSGRVKYPDSCSHLQHSPFPMLFLLNFTKHAQPSTTVHKSTWLLPVCFLTDQITPSAQTASIHTSPRASSRSHLPVSVDAPRIPFPRVPVCPEILSFKTLLQNLLSFRFQLISPTPSDAYCQEANRLPAPRLLPGHPFLSITRFPSLSSCPHPESLDHSPLLPPPSLTHRSPRLRSVPVPPSPPLRGLPAQAAPPPQAARLQARPLPPFPRGPGPREGGGSATPRRDHPGLEADAPIPGEAVGAGTGQLPHLGPTCPEGEAAQPRQEGAHSPSLPRRPASHREAEVGPRHSSWQSSDGCAATATAAAATTAVALSSLSFHRPRPAAEERTHSGTPIGYDRPRVSRSRRHLGT
jgi:hypothetical protein